MPEVHQYLEVSTVHLSDESIGYLNEPPDLRNSKLVEEEILSPSGDSAENGGRCYSDPNLDRGGRRHRWIEGGGDSVWSIPHGHGWFLWVSDDPYDDAVEAGVPANLRAILALARRLSCRWIAFDADAPASDDLPVPETGGSELELAPEMRTTDDA